MARRAAGWALALLAWLTLTLGGAGVAGAAGQAGEAEPAVPGDPALLEQQLEAVDTEPLEQALERLTRSWSGFGPELSLRDAVRLYTGGQGWDLRQILRGLLHYLFREVIANSGLLARLVVLAVLAALLQNLQAAFAQESTGKLAHMVVYLVLAGFALGGFGLAVAAARQVMADLESFMLALLPTLLAVLVGMGGVTSAALLHPVLPVLISGVALLTAQLIFPVLFLAAVLDIASGLSEHIKLTQLAALFRQGAMMAMGLTFTVFLGFTTVKAAAGAVGDSVALRSAKYLTGALVPVVGKMFADAAELVWSSGILLKNALGLLGLAAIFFIAVFPCLKILSVMLAFRAAAALVQPVGQPAIAQCLNTMAGALTLVFSAVATVTLMFFITVTVVVGAANVTVMMR